MASALEKALFSGLHFNKAKYGQDIKLFQKREIKPAEIPISSTLTAALDFFGTPAAQQSEERNAGEAHSEADDNSSSKTQKRNVGDKGKKRSTDEASREDVEPRSRLKKKRGLPETGKPFVNSRDVGSDANAHVKIFKSKNVSALEAAQNEKPGKEAAAQVEAAALLRKRFKIRVSGQDVPAPLEGFGDLSSRYKCKKYLLRNLAEAGYKEPTAIQRQTIPIMLARRECFACAPTGSGKTMAFLIPILMGLRAPSTEGVRAVVLCPTRELALQTARELKKITQGNKFRTRVMTKATAKCVDFAASPCDILISTPLRLNFVLKGGKLDLSRVEYLVLDESDKLFEMGFVEQIDEVIVACTNPKLVRTLFSATLPENVEDLARTVMHDPIRIVIGERNSAAETVKQKLLFVGSEEGKLLAVRQMFQQGLQPPVLMFVQSKERAKQLHKELAFEGLNVDVIHADRTQAQREDVVDNFRSGKTWVLIATDVMARGMDFKGVACVVNYDFPQSIAAYIHRIGRSGRAGRSGEAITLYTEEDAPKLRSIANVMAASGCDVAPWMLALPKQRLRGVEKQRAPHRKDISTAPKYEVMKARQRKEMIEASKRRKQRQLQQAAAAIVVEQ